MHLRHIKTCLRYEIPNTSVHLALKVLILFLQIFVLVDRLICRKICNKTRIIHKLTFIPQILLGSAPLVVLKVLMFAVTHQLPNRFSLNLVGKQLIHSRHTMLDSRPKNPMCPCPSGLKIPLLILWTFVLMWSMKVNFIRYQNETQAYSQFKSSKGFFSFGIQRFYIFLHT